MDKLFDTKDLLTVATVEQAEINTKGYFGDNISNLIEKVRQGEVETLTDVIPDVTYCFESNNDLHYMFFLPIDKVKEKVKKPVYRPIKTIDELFNFLMTDFDADTCDTDKKAELLLDQKYQLKQKITGTIYYGRFNTICLSKDVIRLNDRDLEYFFENFEIKKDGEFVSFGIKDE